MADRAEIALVFAASRANLSAGNVSSIQELIGEHLGNLDWGWLIDQAHEHRVLYLMARNFLRYRLYPQTSDPWLQFRHEELFRLLYSANRARNQDLIDELMVIASALESQAIIPLVRKGPVLIQEVYFDRGVRPMADLDLMLEPDDVPVARQILESLGYGDGSLGASSRVLASVSRREQVYRRLHVPNLVLRRPVDHPFVKEFVIDISLNHFLPGTRWDLPAEQLAARSQETRLFGARVRVFTAEEMLIDLTTHLFKEATTLVYIQMRAHANLLKFLDIAELIGAANIDWSVFVERVRRYRIGPPVYHSLYHTDSLFPGVVPGHVLKALDPRDPAFVRQYGFADKQVREWNNELVDRMFASPRVWGGPVSAATEYLFSHDKDARRGPGGR